VYAEATNTCNDTFVIEELIIISAEMPAKYGIPIAKNKRKSLKHIPKSNGEIHCSEIMWVSENYWRS
jgi:hypothetical protein